MREKCPRCGIYRLQRYEYCPKCGHQFDYIPIKTRKVATYQKCMDCVHFHPETIEHCKKYHDGYLWLENATEENFYFKCYGWCDLKHEGFLFQRTRKRCAHNFEEKK